jgi:lysozyme family protein
MNSFDEAFTALIGNEGGYSDNPKDPGNWSSGKVGEGSLDGTMYGISAPVARRNGYVGPMKNLSLEVAKAIAKREYWDKYQCDQFDGRIAFQVFDAAYNGGRPAQWLQQAAGVTADGVIGAQTIGAVRSADPYKIVALFNSYRLDYLANLPMDTFDHGFMHRVANNLRIGAA